MEPELSCCFLTRFDTRGCHFFFDTYSRDRYPYRKSKKKVLVYFFFTFFCPRGGRASGRLDHGLKSLSGETALAADLITASPARTMTAEDTSLSLEKSHSRPTQKTSPWRRAGDRWGEAIWIHGES